MKWLERTLPWVQRPARYIGGEWNVISGGDRSTAWRIGLCVPAVYERGVGRPGVQALYALLNQHPALAASERIFLPAADFETCLRRAHMPLLTVESKHPMKTLDLLWCFVDSVWEGVELLRLLQLGEVPLTAAHRTPMLPIVIASGPGMANPEPVSPVVDAVCFGGVERLFAVLETTRPDREHHEWKTEFLHRLGDQPGYYLPHRAAHTPSSSFPAGSLVCPPPARVSLTVPTTPVVPFVQTIPAAFVMAPTGPAVALDTLDQQLASTGYEEVRLELGGLPDTEFEAVAGWVGRICRQGVRVSYGALPCRMGSVHVLVQSRLDEARGGRRGRHGGNVTFRLGGVSERIRRCLGEGDESDEDIGCVISRVIQAGWRAIRLECVVGTPWEGDEDAQALSTILRSVKRRCPSGHLQVHGVPWIPRPQTPWQWCLQKDMPMWRAHQERWNKILAIRWPEYEGAVLEGVLARGDRRLGERLIEYVERQGTTEGLAGILGQEASAWLRGRALDEPFPWDSLTSPEFRASLVAQYQAALHRLGPAGGGGHEGLSRGDARFASSLHGGLAVSDIPIKPHLTPETTPAPSSTLPGSATEAPAIQPLGPPPLVLRPGWPEGVSGGPRRDTGWGDREASAAEPVSTGEAPRLVLPESRTWRESQERRGPGVGGGQEKGASLQSERPLDSPHPVSRLGPLRVEAVQRVRFRFGRHGWVRFLSHLEQIEAFRRAFRRSRLPIAWSQGHQPQLRLAFGVAISVGHASDAEYVDAWLTHRVDPVACEAQVKAQLPNEFLCHSVKRIPLPFPSLESIVNVAHYEIQGDGPAAPWEAAVQQWHTHPIEMLEKPKGGTIERIALPPLVRHMVARASGIDLWLRFGAKRHVKPEWIVQRLLPTEEENPRPLLVIRRGLYHERPDGTLWEP